MNKLTGLNHYLKQISNENVLAEVFTEPARAGYTLYLTSKVRIDDYDLYKDHNKTLQSKLFALKNNLLETDLFYQERKDLERYEKLKDMKFVLDTLKELDLSSIKEAKKEPEYVDIRKMLGGKSDKENK